MIFVTSRYFELLLEHIYSNSRLIEALLDAVSDNKRDGAPHIADFDIELVDCAPLSCDGEDLHFTEWGSKRKDRFILGGKWGFISHDYLDDPLATNLEPRIRVFVISYTFVVAPRQMEDMILLCHECRSTPEST
jgi:hypothetical protein